MESRRRETLLVSCNRLMPYASMILLQFAYSGMTILTKSALKQGLSPFILVTYRHAFAALIICPFAIFFERGALSRLRLSTLLKIFALGLLEPVLDQNFYYLGMNCTSATFTATMTNVLPAITFILAWILRLERVEMNERRSLAKVAGTAFSVGGAMTMTLYKGPIVLMPLSGNRLQEGAESIGKNMVKGPIFLVVACFCWSGFVIVQSYTIRSYPWELTLAFLICLAGAVECSVVAFVAERKNLAAWCIGWHLKFLVVAYGAIVCSAMGYFLMLLTVRYRGPVFVTAFSPCGMVIVAVAGLLFLGEKLFVGSLIGAMVIVVGLYMVVWGKSRDETNLSHNEDTAVEMNGGALPA